MYKYWKSKWSVWFTRLFYAKKNCKYHADESFWSYKRNLKFKSCPVNRLNVISSGEIIVKEIKAVKTFAVNSLETFRRISSSMPATKSTPAGGPLRRCFRRPSHFTPRGRESISGAIFELVYTLTRVSRIARPWSRTTHTNRSYVAQGCSSSGSLLYRVCFLRPPPTRIYISNRSVVPPCNA